MDNIQNDPPYLRHFFQDSNEKPRLWPILIITLVVFLIWSEHGSQNLKNNPRSNHRPPKVNPNHNLEESIENAILALRKNHTVVGWRRVMLIAIFSALLILILLYPRRMSHGFIFFIVAAIVFGLAYLVSAWFQHHWFNQNDQKIEDELNKILL